MSGSVFNVIIFVHPGDQAALPVKLPSPLVIINAFKHYLLCISEHGCILRRPTKQLNKHSKVE
jgi:hypothetical protein